MSEPVEDELLAYWRALQAMFPDLDSDQINELCKASAEGLQNVLRRKRQLLDEEEAADEDWLPIPELLTAWRPIETAPKDGSFVFAHNALWHRPMVLSWSGSMWIDQAIPQTWAFPTHWMPIPELPE